MSLPDFKNEAEFRTKWIAPFLAKLGYILPKHVHGTGEQGKDFYFAEHDKFGHLKFCAAQVKLGKVGAGDTELDNLLNQVRRSFAVTLKYHKGADRQRISSVYLMTNESISDRAREYISDWCRQEHYGENVFYLDGETLENLERHATYIDDKTKRNRLVALLNEVNYNLPFVEMLIEQLLNEQSVFNTCRMVAVEDALRNPFTEDKNAYQIISNYWMILNAIEKCIVPVQNGFDLQCREILKDLDHSIQNMTNEILDYITKAIETIDSRYSLEIEIEEPK
tara:strand:- start:1721 stop:2560 length:840 start_codon:yes stop_codon:yes gene_type:complete